MNKVYEVFRPGERVKIKLPFLKKVMGALAMRIWPPKEAYFVREVWEYEAYEVIDDKGRVFYIAMGYLQSKKPVLSVVK